MMSGYGLVLLSFGPGLFWLWYFYQRDRLEPEPKLLILRTFLWGMAAVVPAGLIEWVAVYSIGWISPAVNVILIAPIVEELAKFVSVRYTVYNHDEFDEPMDGIVYAAAAALGFASVENFAYVLAVPVHPEFSPFHQTSLVVGVSVTRGILSVPGHVIFSAMWGYGLGVTKCILYPRRTHAYIITGIILSILLHSVFNLLLTVPLAVIFIFIYMIYVWNMLNSRIRSALLHSPHRAKPFHLPKMKPPEEK